jgi:hypothetical protein
VRRENGLGDAAQLKHHPERQVRGGDDFRASGLGLRHPGRHRQWPAIGQPHDVVDLVVKIVPPDHWQAMLVQWMKVVVDSNFGKALLMGSMSFTCSRR